MQNTPTDGLFWESFSPCQKNGQVIDVRLHWWKINLVRNLLRTSWWPVPGRPSQPGNTDIFQVSTLITTCRENLRKWHEQKFRSTRPNRLLSLTVRWQNVSWQLIYGHSEVSVARTYVSSDCWSSVLRESRRHAFFRTRLCSTRTVRLVYILSFFFAGKTNA